MMARCTKGGGRNNVDLAPGVDYRVLATPTQLSAPAAGLLASRRPGRTCWHGSQHVSRKIYLAGYSC
jgi:hypothetical protein